MVATTSKKKSAPSIKIELIPIADCVNHPDNLDEFSVKYGAKVNESKVENLVALIREHGYDASRLALLRPVVIWQNHQASRGGESSTL